MATQKQSALELFVKSFARTHKKQSVTTRIINAAVTLIDLKLASPDETQLRLPSNSYSVLTNGVLGMLNTMTKSGNADTLNRAKVILQNFLNS